jgi:hypothetical protein
MSEKAVAKKPQKPLTYKGPFGNLSIPFVQARHFTEVSEESPRSPRVIVIHSMEAPEKGTVAESVANYFSHMNDGRVASAHYCIDNNSIVQCVQCKDVAYGAKGMNRHGIHLEHAGYAKQTARDWRDKFSDDMLELSAWLCAKILVPKFDIDIKWLSDDEIRNISNPKISGFVTHKMVTEALNIRGGHTDPGNGFPLNVYLEKIRRFSS